MSSDNRVMDIHHDPDSRRFFVRIDEALAFLEYECPTSDTMDTTHTFVPRELRGRGIAGHIVRAALEHAREEGLTVVPTCPYVAAFIDKNPEYRDLLG